MVSRSWKVALVPVLASLLVACSIREGSGVPASETRVVGRYERLQINTVNAKIEVDPGATTDTIEVKGDDNLVRRVRAHVEGNKLVVDAGDGDVDAEIPLEVILRTAKMTQIDASGTSRVEIMVEAEARLEVRAAGEAKITARGRVGTLEADLAGEAVLHARGLVARTVDLEAAGESVAEVCAEDKLIADIAGRADADYWCEPGDVDREVSSGAHLHAR
jgi:hypothetical protein